MLGTNLSKICEELVVFSSAEFNTIEIANEYTSTSSIIFLLFLGGLDTDLSVLKKTGKIATVSTVFGVLVPLVMGYFAMLYMGYSSVESFAGGVVLTATSIGITVRVMMDLGVLKSEVGAASLSASIMDDFLGIMLIIFAVGSGSILGLLGKFAIFFIITGFLAMKFVNTPCRKRNTVPCNCSYVFILVFSRELV